MIARVLEDLEFPAVLALLRAETVTPPGGVLALTLTPALEPAAVAAETLRTVEAVEHLTRRGTLPFGTLPDPEPLLARLGVEASVLAPLEILDLLTLLQAGRNVKGAAAESRAEFPRIWDLAGDLPDLGNLLRFLDGKISSSGEVLDHASDDLRGIRQQIQERTRRLNALLEVVTARPEVARSLQDTFVSIRNERHVIPIRAEARSAFQGIVHGVSGSGATVYVEPLETVDLNNEIVTLRELEMAEVKRLLQEYSDLLRGRLAELRMLTRTLARLDLLMAKARLGRSMRGTRAEPSAAGEVELRGARHPLVEISLRSQGAALAPLDISLPAGSRVLMISGPNTGGKTVALKTIGLLSLMAQSGLLVPADGARLPVYRRISVDIGDHQSISDRLSTFSARIKTIADIARDLNPPTLILLDEIGTGTDPEEGVALGTAIIDYFRTRGATVVATTHLEALKAYAASTPGCVNAAMEFDEATFAPTYRLVLGIPGRSNALEIAERLDLPTEILTAARGLRGHSDRLIADYLARLQSLSADLETRLRAATEERTRLDAERAALESGFRDKEARQRQAIVAEIEMAVGGIREEGERYLESLKEREVSVRMRREEAKAASKLRTEARRMIRSVTREPDRKGMEAPDLAPGTRVVVDGMGLSGTVESAQGDRVVISVRGKRVTVPRQDCHPEGGSSVETGARGLRLPAGVTFERHPVPSEDEIRLLGLSVEEALERVDKFLDDAYLASLSQVRLIHGVGSGRLKRAVGEMLAGHPHVDTFVRAPSDKGGAGVTIVTLRP